MSIVLLIGGIAGMVWYHTAHAEAPDPQAPRSDPLLNAVATPSMKATRKYFFTVVGLILAQIALTLLGRALWPALKRASETGGLIAMVFLSATCIGAFYAASLVWGQRTHYAMIEYWRWWLVHLWVEGFFSKSSRPRSSGLSSRGSGSSRLRAPIARSCSRRLCAEAAAARPAHQDRPRTAAGLTFGNRRRGSSAPERGVACTRDCPAR